jgi:hypothetical protein
MVMFHTTSHAEAKRRGAIQEEILDDVTSRAASLDGVDLARGRPPDRRAAGGLGNPRDSVRGVLLLPPFRWGRGRV